MDYRFFTNSERAWAAMFEAVSRAGESVYLEMYIFQADTTKFNFLKVLAEKANQGVRVKLILDGFGSFGLSKEEIVGLRGAGVEILFLSYLLHRTHRKVLVIDELVAFIGGVNIHQEASRWNDLAIRISGGLVRNVVKSFAKAYRQAGGQDPLLLAKWRQREPDKMEAWIIDHSPLKKLFNLKKIYRERLRDAHEKIILITPYFLPRRWLGAALHQAVLRGVAVEVLLPRRTDSFIVDRVNYFYMSRLAKLGVKFYLEPQMNHAKALIVDDTEAMVGSHNLDFLSFDYNSEVGVFFQDAAVVAKLLAIAANWQRASTLFDPATYHPRWFDYLLSPFIKLFARIV